MGCSALAFANFDETFAIVEESGAEKLQCSVKSVDRKCKPLAAKHTQCTCLACFP